MSKIVFLDADTRVWARQCGESQDNNDFWPDVSSQYSAENPAPVNPRNSQRRVLFEVALVLTIAGLVAVAAAFFAPLLS